MRVLVAFDKFKDALTARQAVEAAAEALQAKHPDWVLDLCPLTDGGEGFCPTLTGAARGRLHFCAVSGPRGNAVLAPFGLVAAAQVPVSLRPRLPGNGTLAVIDLPSASGLALLRTAERDPWLATTRGSGELLAHTLDAGPDAILLGLGGSATNDLGLGALAALGWRFLDDNGNEIAVPVPATWGKIRQIDASAARRLPPLFLACDVTNPLLGPHGATATFGPQKGLPADDLPRFEKEMARLAAMLCAACGAPPASTELPGTGAAGGSAFGLMVAAQARLVPGFALVSEWLDLPARIAAADLVLTGEGRFDATSLGGKGPGSLVAAARRLGKSVHVFAGSLALSEAEGLGDRSLHAITPPGLPLADALPRTAELLATAVARVL